MKNKWFKLITSVVFCEAVGLIGGLFTFSSIPTWYKTLVRPSFTPPNWIFAPVWTLLYLLMGISLYLVWQKGLNKPKVKYAVSIFLVQLFPNFLWSILFFGLNTIFTSLIDIIFLNVLIILTIKEFYPINKKAAYLLIPYLAWVLFATVLNFSFWILNPS